MDIWGGGGGVFYAEGTARATADDRNIPDTLEEFQGSQEDTRR